MPLCVYMRVCVFLFLDLSYTRLGQHIVEMHPSSLIDLWLSMCVVDLLTYHSYPLSVSLCGMCMSGVVCVYLCVCVFVWYVRL